MIDIVIDANSLWARGYYAAKKVDGNPIVAAIRSVFGVISDVSRIGQVDRMIMAWDGARKTEKSRQEEKPQEYFEHMATFAEVITEILGTAHAHHDDHEADDLVASIVTQSHADKIYVVSSDKDLQSLADDRRVFYYCLKYKGHVTISTIAHKFGIHHPCGIPIALAITGDPGDGIPGIKGWGPAKVKALFSGIEAELGYDETLSLIVDKINTPGARSQFLECLDHTYLKRGIEGLPAPSPLTWMPAENLAALGLEELEIQYLRLTGQLKMPSFNELE